VLYCSCVEETENLKGWYVVVAVKSLFRRHWTVCG